MKSKGAVKLFAIAMAVVSVFQLSFTWVTYRIEKEAKAFAEGDVIKERAYLDSIAREPVYNLGFAEYTYLQCKERELNLGLDLQGGMNVTLEVSLGEMVRALANNNPDPGFNKAIELAAEKMKTSQADYVTLFGEAYKETVPEGRLAAIFANQTNKDRIKVSSTNEEVLVYLREEANQAIDRSFQILRARIDKFGVTQPNIQKLEGSGRILVELPGVDNPTRVRKLLQGSAKLEFWETYDNAEAFKHLSSANDMLAKVMKSEAGTKSDSTKTDTAASALAGLAKPSAIKPDSTKKDTANKEKTFEEFSAENPLFAYLRPYADENNMLITKGSACGISMVKDTAKINAMLNRFEVKAVLPSTIKFFWAYKGFGNNNEAVVLHAVKAGKDGNPSLEGDK
ncbi:MAG: protein translocase subunit SecDF, partial [Bacteroidota bacterium]